MDTENIPLKRCSRKAKCINPLGEWLPATPEYFYVFKRAQDGISPACKVCTNVEQKAYRERNATAVKERGLRYRELHRADAATKSRQWYQDHKVYAIQRAAEWQVQHPEKVREIKRKSAEKHREETNAKLREKWHCDPEYRTIHYQRGLDWKHRHPGYQREEMKRKAAYTLNNAVRLGKFPPAKTFSCEECGADAQHYHHHNGYEPEHWFDVVPLCTKCHGKTWRKMA